MSNPNWHPAHEAGTPITNYVGTLAASPQAAIAPARVRWFTLASTPLGWAMRAAFALLGAGCALFLYSAWVQADGLYSLTIPPVEALAVASSGLLAAWWLKEKSYYVNWAVIAVTFTLLMPFTLAGALWRYQNALWMISQPTLLQDIYQLQFQHELYISSFFYITLAAAMSLLAGLAVAKSLPIWGMIIALPLVIASLASGLQLAPFDYNVLHNTPEQARLAASGFSAALICTCLMPTGEDGLAVRAISKQHKESAPRSVRPI
jgi:hypothetical protein